MTTSTCSRHKVVLADRMGRLTNSVQELAESQKHTEQQLKEIRRDRATSA